MKSQSVALHDYKLSESAAYVSSLVFIVCGIALPQLCHAFGVGRVMLPIYFFTLVAAYKCGLSVGLITAFGIPVANHLLFGMPPTAALPSILVKSVLLAAFASMAARRSGRVSLVMIAAVVLAYQVVGTAIEWAAFAPSFHAAVVDFRIGVPGMLLQIFGGFLFLKYVFTK